jgi:hypothetical protein
MDEERRKFKERRTNEDRRAFKGPVPEVFDRRDLDDPKDRRSGKDRRKNTDQRRTEK